MNTKNKMGIGALVVACVVASLVAPQIAAAAPSSVPNGAEAATVSAEGPAAAAAQVKATPQVTMDGGPRLRVHVAPEQAGPGAWQFTLERKGADGWEWDGDYLTKGTNEEISLPVAAGTYRVVVPAQNGLSAATSKEKAYLPTPDITVGGYGALEVTVGPIRDWRVTLERKTDQGWVTAKRAKTRGTEPMVFSVDDGTYRVRTEANGRFPAHTGAAFDFARQSPPGPIPYGMVDAMFSDNPAPGKKTRTLTPRSASSNCASVMNPSPDYGVTIATGLINFIPYVGRTISSGINSQQANAQATAEQNCLSAQFAAMNAQLSFQEAQIQQIQTELSQAKTEVLAGFYQTDGEIVNSDLNAYTASLNDLVICTNDGLLWNFMTSYKFWTGCPGKPDGSTVIVSGVTGNTVQEVATSPDFASYYGAFTAAGAATDLLLPLQEVSASQVLGNEPCSYPSPLVLPLPAGQNAPVCTVTPYGNSQIQTLYEAVYTQFKTALDIYQDNGENVVPLFDQYNDSIAAYFGQSAVAVQAAFTVESLINQLNYYNAGQDTAIPSLSKVAGTHYSYQGLEDALGTTPTASEQAQYYNLAQQALANVYAGTMNQLYQTTIGYIVTDTPVLGQAWPDTTKIDVRIDYADNVGRYVTTPLNFLPNVASGDLQPASTALYQYVGLRDAGACYQGLLGWNQTNVPGFPPTGTYPWAYPPLSEVESLCPSILTTAAGGAVSAGPLPDAGCDVYASPPGGDGSSLPSCYDGNTLAPYYAPNDAGLVSTSYVFTNLLLCDATDPSLTWFNVTSANSGNAAGLVEGNWALTCGNWAGPNAGFPGAKQSWSGGEMEAISCTYPNGGNAFSVIPSGIESCWLYDDSFLGLFQYTSVEDAYQFDSFIVENYYLNMSEYSNVTYIASNDPLNIGAPNTPTYVAFPTYSTCVGYGTTASTSVSGCEIDFGPVNSLLNSDINGYVGEMELAALTASLPNTAAGSSSGGFALPLWVGTAYEITANYSTRNAWTWLAVWVASNTSLADVGFVAPPALADPGDSIPWQPSGYITVADGSCWGINIGRMGTNKGAIQFSQQPLGSACAS